MELKFLGVTGLKAEDLKRAWRKTNQEPEKFRALVEDVEIVESSWVKAEGERKTHRAWLWNINHSVSIISILFHPLCC